ncbi:MAG: hypothetical protein R3195_17535 [Gemmatimonadota bacterium]|nr:hypothetical protein [Gemmatimonadota bacterium]
MPSSLRWPDSAKRGASTTFQQFWWDRLDDVPVWAEMSGRDDEATTLSAVLDDTDVALVAYWHTPFPAAPSSLARYEPLAPTVDALSLTVIGVIGDLGREGPAVFERLPESGWEILHDAAGELRAAMRRWPTAKYLVIQDGRRIRFAGDLEDAVRVAVVLRSADG